MKTWLRLVLITMAVGGGFSGVVSAVNVFISTRNLQPLPFLFLILFVLLYAFVTISGLIFVANPKRTRPLMVALALQIPWLSSPILAFKFFAGLQISTWLIGGRFGWDFFFGSDFNFNMFTQLPWGFGINLFALAMLIALLRGR